MEETNFLADLEAKFTKANMFAALTAVANGELTVEDLLPVVKPQKGGGASANPAKEIDGVTHHYCRLKDEYVPEEDMNMSQGKSKGTSKLASKVAYRIKTAADDIRGQALKAFTTGQYEEGAKLNGEADTLEATIENPATFTNDAMAESIYHPDFGKKTTTEENASDEIL